MKPQKSTVIILISLLSASLIWNLIFWLPDVSVEIAQFIQRNPITHTLGAAYDDFFAPLLCVLFSFGNLVFAAIVLFEKYRSKKYPSEESDEKLTVYLVYTFVSSVALVIHCLSFIYIFSCLVAG